MRTLVKPAIICLIAGLSTQVLSGCGGNTSTASSGPEEVQAFKGGTAEDRAKAHAEAMARMKQAETQRAQTMQNRQAPAGGAQ